MLLLYLNVGNPAAAPAGALFADDTLRQRVSYVPFVTIFEDYLAEHEAPGSEGVSILHLLRAPLLASPDSLFGQLSYIRDHWAHLLPEDMLRSLQLALDVLREIDLHRDRRRRTAAGARIRAGTRRLAGRPSRAGGLQPATPTG